MSEISVIVPVYKVEPYLCACIDTILEQTFGDYELILVDDGSPDRCGDICDEYAVKDDRIKVIHQKNQGLSAARNVGIENSTGKYITFIDSDDVVGVDYLKVLYESIVKETAEISCCCFVKFSGRCKFEKSGTAGTHICMSGREAAVEQYACGRPTKVSVSAWGKLYDRRFFDHIRFPNGRIHEDQAVVPIVLSQANKVVACAEPLYYYRIREDSITQSRFTLKRYDDLIAIDECLEYFRQQKEDEIIAAAEKRKRELLAEYSFEARKAKIFKNVPAKYRISRYTAIKYLRDILPYDAYSYRIVKVYPIFIIGAYIRNLQSLWPLKFGKK